MESLQKESEWDENIKEVADELWELLPPNFSYKNINRKTMYNWIRTRLENILYNREKEIAEEINSFPLSDSMFFDENNWKAGYKALEEFKNYLLKH